MSELPNLHDAQLSSIQVDWAAKVARLRLAYGWPTNHGVLQLSGLCRIHMTLLDGWGPSGFVLTVKREQVDEGHHLLIEMQSGDVIDAVAKSVELHANESAIEP